MTSLEQIRKLLQESSNTTKRHPATFCKTTPGHYAEHDQFINVDIPTLRKIAKDFQDLSLEEIQTFLESPINQERALALFMLVNHYQKPTTIPKEDVYQFYLRNLQHVNNWNLVDSSAHLIIGAHIFNTNKDILVTLAQSDNLWKRRIAMIATFFFIRKNDVAWTFKIAKILLNDHHDLIHKAVGWMLREAGKRDLAQLLEFLDEHTAHMPRTMLRYAIEKLDKAQREKYLALKHTGAL